jgi:hypothetical protein
MIEDILWEPQKEAVNFIVNARRVLLADQPGSGKTLMSLAALERDGLFEDGISLVLAPKFPAKTTWYKDHALKFVAPRGVQIVDLTSGTAEQKNARLVDVQSPALIIANHDALAVAPGNKARVPNLLKYVYDAVVVDESHRVLPTSTDVRWQMTQFWRGLALLKINPQGLRLAVSGTPDRSKLENRYGTLKFLFPEVYTNREHWLHTNFDMMVKTIYLSGGRTKDMVIPQKLRDPHSWVARDQLYLLRRTKAEIQANRPAKQYIPVQLDMNKPQYVAYMKFLREYLRGESSNAPSITPAVYALRSRQIAISSGWDWEKNDIGDSFSSSKLDWIIEWMLERGYDDPGHLSPSPSKVVIASSFTASLRWIKRELAKLGIRAEILDGSVNGNERARIQSEFQQHESSLRVVLLSMTMGVGIDLDAADDMIFLDLPYSPDEAEQVEDRIDRLSRQHRMTIWWLMSNGTIDLAIAETNAERYHITRELLDGSRGITTARQVLNMIRSNNV